jgi:hypothetical protein
MKPSIVAEALALYGRSLAMGAPLPTAAPAGFNPKSLIVAKAAVDSMMTGDSGVLGSEGGDIQTFFTTLSPQSAFVQALRRGLLIQSPFHVAFAAAIANVSGHLRNEGHAAPVTRFSLQRRVLTPQPLDALIVASDELLKVPGASQFIQDMLSIGCANVLDSFFHNSVLSSTTASFDASGTAATNFFADLKKLFAAVFPAGTSTARGFFVMDSASALAISLLITTGGFLAVPSMGLAGGLIAGLPAFVSAGWPTGKLSLFNGERIGAGLDDTLGFAASNEAAIEMVDAPLQNAIDGTGAAAVSMFQTSSTAMILRMRAGVEMVIDSAAAEIVGAAYL